MEKLKLSIKIILIINLLLLIGFGIFILVSGIQGSEEAAQTAANQGAENGSVIGGAIAGGLVGAMGIVLTIIVGGIFLIYAFNTLIALIIYCLKQEHGVFGGILVFLLSCPIAGVLIIIEASKS